MIGLLGSNAFGIDGRSLWMNAVVFSSSRDLRRDLAGRHIAISLIAVPLLAAVAMAGAWVSGDPGLAVPAMLTAWGVLGIGMGVGAVVSVLVPYTYPDRINAFSGAAPGQGGAAFVASFGATICTNLIGLPLVVPVLVGVTPLSGVVAAYGLAVAWAGRRLAAVIGYRRLPDIVVAVSRPTS
jgi:ABC-2 type transport system permease protein